MKRTDSLKSADDVRKEARIHADNATGHIASNALELIGDTPLLDLSRASQAFGAKARVLAKLECFNPGGSSKDRAALRMIREAEESGALAPGATIIESTSGNTGIGLALAGAILGYPVIIVMPDSMSVERRLLMSAYGAQLVLTPGKLGMKGANDKAAELAKSIPGGFLASQFSNPANAMAHFDTTGPEIWKATAGRIDAFVAGIGTGGTITGAGRYLKEQDPDIQLVGVEPADSPVITRGVAGTHKLQGIGAGFVPDILDVDLLDTVLTCTTEDAFNAARTIACTEGVLVGISSGAAAWAAFELAKQEHYENATIVVLLPDTGERYLSSGLFEVNLCHEC